MIAAALAARQHIFEPRPLANDCRYCRNPQFSSLRAEWGCDAPTPFPQLVIPCVRCRGYDPDCEVCGGSDRESLYDCPSRLVASVRGEILEAVALHVHWPTALPFAGGLYDQPAQYVEAMQVLDSATALIEQTQVTDGARPRNLDHR